jgi:hypothetical protein
MNERDIRNAFEHLEQDVMSNVRTEERLGQITKRPTWVRPAFLAFVGSAAVALIVGAAVLAFRSDSDTNPVPPATGEPTTTLAATTSEAPAPTLPGVQSGTVLLAELGATPTSSDGAVVVDGWTVTGDGAGGLLVDRSETITRVAADATETVLLDAADLSDQYGRAALRLEDVASVDGAAKAMVTVLYGEAYPNIFQEIWLVDVGTGATESLYQMVAVEANITRVSVAAGRMVVSIAFEGGTYFEYLDIAGQPIDVVGPFYEEPIGVAAVPTVIDQGVLSPDGSMFLYLEIDYSTLEEGSVPVAIVSWDLDAGAETGRLEVELRDGARPGRLDFDGVGFVLERYLDVSDGPLTSLPPLRAESLADGTISELDTAGRPSLVK